MKQKLFLIILALGSYYNEARAQQAFHNFEELFTYAKARSISLQSNTIRISQARKAKLAAMLSVPDVSGNLFSATFTDNTKLGVNLFPAEAFGGTPGTYKTVKTGIQYNTNLNNYVDVKLVNLSAIYNLQLAKINIQLSESNNLLTLKSLKESVASSYYNLVALQKQYETSIQNTQAADTLFVITKNKYNNGLAKQQDVNDAQSSLLSNKENANQIQFLINQTYLTIKLLCDIPEQEEIIIAHNAPTTSITTSPLIEVNNLKMSNYILQEKYALNSYKSAKSAFAPTLSAPFSNSYNIYSSTFKVLDGNWINSNFIGLKLNVPIPSANVVAKKYSSYYEYQLAEKNTQQAKIKAQLEQEQLKIEYEKAFSQALVNKEILTLRQDSYLKNKMLYSKGLIGLEQTINSFNTMVNANYNLISSQTSVELALTKIEINNSIK